MFGTATAGIDIVGGRSRCREDTWTVRSEAGDAVTSLCASDDVIIAAGVVCLAAIGDTVPVAGGELA